MNKNIKYYFFRFLNLSLTFRHWLKLKIFKSPMSEISSLKYSIHKIKSQIVFKIKNKKSISFNSKARDSFNKLGYATFSNVKIENNSRLILKKISRINNPWDKENRLKLQPSIEFKDEFIEIFYNGVDQFIKSIFDSDYRIHYHTLYISKRDSTDEQPQGSALWHGDGGPGIRMNLMICHTPLNSSNGAMKIIPFNISINLLTKTFYNYRYWYKQQSDASLRKFDRTYHRTKKCEKLNELIKSNSIKFYQPNTTKSGLIYAFNNNCVHRGGFTQKGSERIVSLMHIYPSYELTSISEKFNCSHEKIEDNPKKL